MTTRTAAIRYARALFDVALQEKADLDRVGQDVSGFNDLVDQQPALREKCCSTQLFPLRANARRSQS